MISYTIICDNDHEFSKMFDNYDDFVAQQKVVSIECPTCGSKSVTKGLSTPTFTEEM